MEYLPNERSPYKFYKNENGVKLKTRPIILTDNYSLLRLHTIMFSPTEIRNDLKLKVFIDKGRQSSSHEYLLSKLYCNPIYSDTIFFRNGNIDYTDIMLPQGDKRITFSIAPLKDNFEFECSLSCMYLKKPSINQELRYSIEDFDLLKVNPVISELCLRCISSENHNEVFSEAFSDLVREVERVTIKRIFALDLCNELIQFFRITKFKDE